MTKLTALLLPLVLGIAAAGAQATALRLTPASSALTIGAVFNVGIVADIDAVDEIIGFGFDLASTGGLSFLGFTAGTGFADDPTYLAPFSDADGIRGAVGGDLLSGGPISGNGLLLGTLQLLATGLGSASLSLTADDLAVNFTEGLIPLSIATTNFMPPVTAAFFDVRLSAPEPESAWTALVIAGIVGWQRRAKRGLNSTA